MATAARRTDTAPPARKAAAAERNVAPVVTTSSTTSRRRPAAAGLARNTGPWRRSMRGRPVCGRSAPSRTSNRRHEMPSWRATRRATSSAGSNPRRRRLRRLVGAQVTTSMSAGSRPSASSRLTSSPAKWWASWRRLRYLKPSTACRARPANGTAAITSPDGRPAGTARATRQGLHSTGPTRWHPAQRDWSSMPRFCARGCHTVGSVAPAAPQSARPPDRRLDLPGRALPEQLGRAPALVARLGALAGGGDVRRLL